MQKKVSLEFVAPSIEQLIDRQRKEMSINNDKNGNIIKNIAKSVLYPKIISCTEYESKVIIRGVNIGYDEVLIALSNRSQTRMFVSVFKAIKPLHKSVAI